MAGFMRRLTVGLFASCLVLGLTLGCNPDLPEGPSYSFYSIKHKLTKKWLFASAIENKIPKTALYQEYVVEFTDSGDFIVCYTADSCEQQYSKWRLSNGNKTLQILRGDSTTVLDIIRLSSSTLKLQSSPLTNQKIEWELTRKK
jgi:hypothetical protein